jgi:hypothetical protein
VSPPRGAVASECWASLVDEDDESDEEGLTPMTPPATSNSPLASDPAVLVNGLGSLLVSPVASAGPTDDVLLAPSLL